MAKKDQNLTIILIVVVVAIIAIIAYLYGNGIIPNVPWPE